MMEWVFKLMSEDNLYNAIKAIVFAWLMTEALKRLSRTLYKEMHKELVWVLAIIIGAITCYHLHESPGVATSNPVVFFSIMIGLAAPVLHNLIFIQLASWVEDLLTRRWGIKLNLRAALTGNPAYKKDPEDKV